jgi:phage baseplate assembly protein gpV
MLVAETRINRFQENGMDNRSVPNLIDYQGKITDSSSNPITGTVSIEFAIYEESTGGIALWTETHSSVEAIYGLVHVQMGSETTFGDDLFDGSERWLSINVNSDGEMTPRLRIVSVPYAIYANDSDNLNGNDSSYFMPASTDNWVDITGDTMTGNLVVNADFQATGIIHDSGGDAGTNGQVLSTTSIGTDWVDAIVGAEEINDLTDGKTGGLSVFLGSGAGTNDDSTNNCNISVGINALHTNISGYCNTANGYQSLYANSTGNNNTANGSQALYYNTGSDNTAFGMNALCYNTSGEYNVGIGAEANDFNQTGSQNTIIGYQAGRGTGLHNKSGNVFLGYRTGYYETGSNKLYIENSDGSPLIYGEFDNDYVKINGSFEVSGTLYDDDHDAGTGGQVLSSTETGTDWVDATQEINDLTDGKSDGLSVFLGSNAGANNDGIDNYNVGVGIDALSANTSGIHNTANGFQALYTNSTGNSNTANGIQALLYNTGSHNTAFGSFSLVRNTSGECNVGIGIEANAYNQEGSQNTIIGYKAGRGTIDHDKSGNIFLGFQAGYFETGSNKLFIECSDSDTPLIYGEFDNDKIVINGEFQATGITRDSGGDAGTSGQVLSSIGTGTDWVDAAGGAEEIDDLLDGKTGGYSVFLGSGAGTNDNGSDNKNVGVGIDALYTNSTGYRNTANGYQSLYLNSSGNHNTANGYHALYYNTGTSNTSVGSYSLNRNTIGAYNIGIGVEANRYNQEGSQNTIIGYQAGRGTLNHDKSGNVFLGYKSGYYETGSNKLYIENSDIDTPLIYGEFDNDYLKINGDFEVIGILYDDDHDAGTSGQVLSTTGLGTDWVDMEINDLTDGKTSGSSVFLGSNAGANDNGSDNYNVGIGIDALYTNTSGINNTANGFQALGYNTGSRNTAFGMSALNRNINGGYNIGIGYQANYYNQEGSQNTIIGCQAGRGTSDHDKSGNVFLGYKAGYSETESNKLYIENSDGPPLIYGEFDNDYIKINGDFEVTGILYDDDHDAGTNGQILSSTSTGTDWVEMEINDLTDGKTGGNSVFLGSGAGTSDDNSENRNVGVGINALHTNFTGYRNTANGYNTLYTNSTGNYNTANGYQALYYNTDSRNTALGSFALHRNTSGEHNVGIGFETNGNNQEGSYNTMIGYQAGCGGVLHDKSGNVFIGYSAGYNETGDNRLYIENSSSSIPLIWGDFTNNRIVINGNSGHNTNNRTFFSNGSAGGTTTWSNDSDIRLKKNISTISSALDKVIHLHGVNYEWKETENHAEGLQMGFIAQEVKEIIPEVVDSNGDYYSMQYAPITALLVEAIKEQQQQMEKQQQQIEELKQQIAELR